MNRVLRVMDSPDLELNYCQNSEGTIHNAVSNNLGTKNSFGLNSKMG